MHHNIIENHYDCSKTVQFPHPILFNLCDANQILCDSCLKVVHLLALTPFPKSKFWHTNTSGFVKAVIKNKGNVPGNIIMSFCAKSECLPNSVLLRHTQTPVCWGVGAAQWRVS